MRDTVWEWQIQSMVKEDGTPKGMKMVLEERGINTRRMNADDMHVVLSYHDDFHKEKIIVEHYLEGRGDVVFFVPKFHCENLRVKDHHVFRSDIGRGDSFVCERESINAYSEVVK